MDKVSIPVLGLYPRTLTMPVSITYRIPEIVIEVSAILVARMTLRVFGGAGSNTLVCCEVGSDAKMGQTIILN